MVAVIVVLLQEGTQYKQQVSNIVLLFEVDFQKIHFHYFIDLHTMPTLCSTFKQNAEWIQFIFIIEAGNCDE